MAKSEKQSGLFGKLGKAAQDAHKKFKGETTTPAVGGALPPGIEGGVAQLVDFHFGVYADGDYSGKDFFMAQGVMQEPAELKVTDKKTKKTTTFKVAGKRTKLGPIPLCNKVGTSKSKVKTTADAIALMYEHWRGLGIDTDSIDEDNPTAWEDIAQHLNETMPYFSVRTYRSNPTNEYPNPTTQEVWEGLVDYTPSADGQTSGMDEGAAPEEPENEPEAGDAEDLDAIVEACNAKDKKAQKQLGKIASEAGISDEAIEDAADWESLRGLIDAAREGTAAEPEAEPEVEAEPVTKGDDYNYHPIDPKTDEPRKKGIVCEVTAVDKVKKTATLKARAGGTVYKTVKWSDLKPV